MPTNITDKLTNKKIKVELKDGKYKFFIDDIMNVTFSGTEETVLDILPSIELKFEVRPYIDIKEL